MKGKRARESDPAKGAKEILAAASLIINNNKKKPKVSNVDVDSNGFDVCKHCSKRHKSDKCWSIAVWSRCTSLPHQSGKTRK